MKKKQMLAVILAAMLAAGGLAGCGGNADSSSSAAASEKSSGEEASSADADDAEDADTDDMDEDGVDEDEDALDEEDEALLAMPLAEDGAELADCIKLGEYKGLKLTKNVTEITDEAVETYADANAELEEVTDENAAVEDGDTANIAYVGEKDGVAFDGGSSDSYDLEIGSGTFIDGFEDGLIGMKKGETKDLNLTFPEDYGSEELAGADVVFHVTVNSISRAKEITDADLEAARKELEEDYDQEAVTQLQTDAWMMVKDNSEFKQLRKADVDGMVEETKKELNEWIESMDISFDEYLEMQDMTKDEYEQQIQLYARDMAREMLLVDALAKAEGITADDQEYKDILADLAADNDQTEEELIKDAGEAVVYQYVMTQRLLERIVSYADVTVETVSANDMADLEGYDILDADDDEVEFEEIDEDDPDYEEDDDELIFDEDELEDEDADYEALDELETVSDSESDN